MNEEDPIRHPIMAVLIGASMGAAISTFIIVLTLNGKLDKLVEAHGLEPQTKVVEKCGGAK